LTIEADSFVGLLYLSLELVVEFFVLDKKVVVDLYGVLILTINCYEVLLVFLGERVFIKIAHLLRVVLLIAE